MTDCSFFLTELQLLCVRLREFFLNLLESPSRVDTIENERPTILKSVYFLHQKVIACWSSNCRDGLGVSEEAAPRIHS